MIVKMNGKKYTVTSVDGKDGIFRKNFDEEMDDHFNGKGIDAQWSRHILAINKELRENKTYKAGRPCKKAVQEAINAEDALEIGQ